MQLQAGFSFCIAPRFHSRLAWADRIQLNSGVEGATHRFYPCSDWRSPSPAELALLVDAPAQVRGSAEETLSPLQTGVLVIPAHLRAAWWTMIEQFEVSSGDLA